MELFNNSLINHNVDNVIEASIVNFYEATLQTYSHSLKIYANLSVFCF